MTCDEAFYGFLNFGALVSCSYYFCRQIFSRPKSGKPGKRRRSFVRKRIQLRTEGSVFSMLRRRLQKGQLMFSHPHCIVELLGALTTLTVRSPRRVQSLLANRVSRSWWPDLKMFLLYSFKSQLVIFCYKPILRTYFCVRLSPHSGSH